MITSSKTKRVRFFNLKYKDEIIKIYIFELYKNKKFINRYVGFNAKIADSLQSIINKYCKKKTGRFEKVKNAEVIPYDCRSIKRLVKRFRKAEDEYKKKKKSAEGRSSEANSYECQAKNYKKFFLNLELPETNTLEEEIIEEDEEEVDKSGINLKIKSINGIIKVLKRAEKKGKKDVYYVKGFKGTKSHNIPAYTYRNFNRILKEVQVNIRRVPYRDKKTKALIKLVNNDKDSLNAIIDKLKDYRRSLKKEIASKRF
jgi:hypothetical protein